MPSTMRFETWPRGTSKAHDSQFFPFRRRNSNYPLAELLLAFRMSPFLAGSEGDSSIACRPE